MFVLTLLVLENIFSVKGGLLMGPPGILAIENRLLSLEIRLRLSLFHLRFHFSNHLEELAFGEWSWVSIVNCPCGIEDVECYPSTSSTSSTTAGKEPRAHWQESSTPSPAARSKKLTVGEARLTICQQEKPRRQLW